MFGKHYLATLVALLTFAVVGCEQQAEPEAAEPAQEELASEEAKISYIFGLNIAENFRSQEINLDPDALALAMEDVYGDREPRLSEEEIQLTMQTFQQEQMEKQQAAMAEAEEANRKAAEDNKKAGDDFLAQNAEKEGVVTLPSGLQYKMIEEGSGPKPGPEDTVTVHYRGTLVDGTQFDSSYDRGEPVSFPLDGVIPGWTEGLQQMSEGSKFELYIPPNLAYGPGGSGPIGPNSTLNFEIELLEVDPKEGEESEQQ